METKSTANLTEAFETETCSRCGGSGHHSYCQMYGTTCFKCSGKGNVYTKRATAAMAYARQLRTLRATDVRVGMLMFIEASPLGGKSGWFPVITISEPTVSAWSINPDGTKTEHIGFTISTKECGYGVYLDSTVQAVPNKERLTEIRTLALSYQATLTQKGVPAKAPRKQLILDGSAAVRETTHA